jgi:hypothetical protein
MKICFKLSFIYQPNIPLKSSKQKVINFKYQELQEYPVVLCIDPHSLFYKTKESRTFQKAFDRSEKQKIRVFLQVQY